MLAEAWDGDSGKSVGNADVAAYNGIRDDKLWDAVVAAVCADVRREGELLAAMP